MTHFLSLGRWLFAIPIGLFGFLHLMTTDQLASAVAPVFLQAGPFWTYLVGLGMLATAATMLIGRYDQIGALTLACFLLAVVLIVRVPSVLYAGIGQAAVSGILKDLSLAGAALLYARFGAVDRKFNLEEIRES